MGETAAAVVVVVIMVPEEMAENTAAAVVVLPEEVVETAEPTAEAAGAEMEVVLLPGKAGPTAEMEGLETRMEVTGKKQLMQAASIASSCSFSITTFLARVKVRAALVDRTTM